MNQRDEIPQQRRGDGGEDRYHLDMMLMLVVVTDLLLAIAATREHAYTMHCTPWSVLCGYLSGIHSFRVLHQLKSFNIRMNGYGQPNLRTGQGFSQCRWSSPHLILH